jgi:hypothetical protein
MLYIIALLAIFVNFHIVHAGNDGSNEVKLIPVYAKVAGVITDYGSAPMGADLDETMDDLPCIKDVCGSGRYICASGEFIIIKAHDMCKFFIYDSLFEINNLAFDINAKDWQSIKNGQIIGYTERGSVIKPKIVNTCCKTSKRRIKSFGL